MSMPMPPRGGLVPRPPSNRVSVVPMRVGMPMNKSGPQHGKGLTRACMVLRVLARAIVYPREKPSTVIACRWC